MGYWGEAGDTVTWKNPQFVSEGQRQSGGWYYNPDTGRVDRWWSGSPPATTSSGGGGGGSTSSSGQNYMDIMNKALEEQRAAEERARQEREAARQKELQYYQQAKGEEQGLLSRFTSAIQALEPITAIRERLGQEYNVAGLQQAANFLTSTLENIPQAVKNLAGIVGISAPRQEMRMQAMASNITPAQQQATRQLQTAQEGVTTGLQYEVAQQERGLQPFEQEFTVLKERIARESAGFTAENKAQLDILLKELDTRGTLTEQQLQLARDLAQKEEEYELEKMKLENTREVITADGRVKLIDSSGNLIADLGSSRSGTASSPVDIDAAIDAYVAQQQAASKEEENLKTIESQQQKYTAYPWLDYTPVSQTTPPASMGQ
jgi:hypothetical protein